MKNIISQTNADYNLFSKILIVAMAIILLFPGLEGKSSATTISQSDIAKFPENPPEVVSGSKFRKGSEPILLASDQASPETGYGEKSETEIMAEKPRATRIAALGPMTGQLKFYGVEASNGAELASDEINESGGIRGRRFDLLVYDTKGSVTGTQYGIEKLLEYETMAIVGAATGEVSFSASKILNDNQLIMVSAGSRRRLGDTGPYNFRSTLTDKAAVKGLVNYIKANRNWKNFALFSSVINDYSIKLTAFFKVELVDQGFNINHELFLWSSAMSNMREEDVSIVGQLVKLKKDLPDAIVFTGSATEAAEFVREMKKLGMNIPIVGAEDLMAPDFVELGAEGVEALVYGGFDVNSKNKKVQAFVEAYTKRFKSAPTRLAALSYDTYYIIAEAIGKAKSMRPSHVRETLLATKDFMGVTGKLSFDETGEAIKAPYVFEFKKAGKGYAFVTVSEPF